MVSNLGNDQSSAQGMVRRSPERASGGIRGGMGNLPEADGVPSADHGAMETNSMPPQDGARDGASTRNRTGQRTLRRSSHDRLFAGVGAGVADYLGTDVTATRVGLAAIAVLRPQMIT